MTLRRHTLFAVVALVALVAVTSIAMSNSVIGNTDNEDFIGTRDRGRTIAKAATARSAGGRPVSWGVFGYTSDRGLTCLQAGPVEDDAAGAFTPRGFERFSPLDSVGNCGDLTEPLATLGGVAYAAVAPVSTDSDDRASVVYGLAGKNVKNVTVTIDKTSERLPVEMSGASELGGAAQSFIAPLPPEASLPGVTVTFELANGKRTVSTI